MSSEIFKRLNLRGFQVGKQIPANLPLPSRQRMTLTSRVSFAFTLNHSSTASLYFTTTPSHNTQLNRRAEEQSDLQFRCRSSARS
jgi:hypothetical protein